MAGGGKKILTKGDRTVQVFLPAPVGAQRGERRVPEYSVSAIHTEVGHETIEK